MTSLFAWTQDTAAVEALLPPEVSRGTAFPFLPDVLGAVAIALVVALCVGLITRTWRDASSHVLLPALGLGTSGLTVGLLIGNSLTSVVNLGVSGLLTALSGLVIYLISKENVPGWTRVSAAVGLASMAAGLLYGASIGSAYRYRHQAADALWVRSLEQQEKRYDADLRVYEYAEKKRIDVLADSATTSSRQ